MGAVRGEVWYWAHVRGSYRIFYWVQQAYAHDGAPTKFLTKSWTYLKTRNIRFRYNTLRPIIMPYFVIVLYTLLQLLR